MATTEKRRTAGVPTSGTASAGKAGRYQRARDLPRLLPLMAHELETATLTQHLALLGLIRRGLRRERQRGVSGHWAYNLTRHAGLLAAYRAERALVAERLRSDRSNPRA
jgi:hypothetical protein